MLSVPLPETGLHAVIAIDGSSWGWGQGSEGRAVMALNGAELGGQPLSGTALGRGGLCSSGRRWKERLWGEVEGKG